MLLFYTMKKFDIIFQESSSLYCDIHGVFIFYPIFPFYAISTSNKWHCGLDSIDSVNSTIVKVQNQESVFMIFRCRTTWKQDTQLNMMTHAHTHAFIHSFIYLVVRRSISGRDTYSDAIYDTSRTKKKPVDWQDHVFFSRKRKAASWIKTSSSKLPTNQINQSVLTLSLNFLTIPFAIAARSNLNPLIQLLSSSFKRNGKKRTKIRVLDRQFFHVSYTEKCI